MGSKNQKAAAASTAWLKANDPKYAKDAKAKRMAKLRDAMNGALRRTKKK